MAPRVNGAAAKGDNNGSASTYHISKYRAARGTRRRR